MARLSRRPASRTALHLLRLEDRTTPTTTILSVLPGGVTAGNGRSVPPFATATVDAPRHVVSDDGRVVLFASQATDLTADPTNGQFNLFARDTQTGTTTLVSKSLTGRGEGNARAVLAGGGRYVLLDGGIDNGYVPTSSFAQPQNGGGHLFRRDLLTGTTDVVDLRPDGLGGVGGFGGGGLGGFADLSADGRFVVFTYSGRDLVPGDTRGDLPFGFNDLYVRDMVAGTTKLVNHTLAGGFSTQTVLDPMISANGKTILFRSAATDLTATPDANGIEDLFAYDVATGAVTLVSVGTDGKAATGATLGASLADIDASGSKVLFCSNAQNLVSGDGFSAFDGYAFLRDLTTGTTTLVSRLPVTGAPAGVAAAGQAHPVLSADGKFVAFTSRSEFTGGFPDGQTDDVLYLYEAATGRFTAASTTPTGLARQGVLPSVSADGRYVSFTSGAADLVPGVTVEGAATFVYDRLADRVFAASTDATGKAGRRK